MTTYYFLGEAYADFGNKEKAIEALEKSIELCKAEGRDQESFPYKEARKRIDDLNSEV